MHSVLLGRGNGLPFSHLIDHPALFPFAVHVMRNPILRVRRQGDQSDFVELARSGVQVRSTWDADATPAPHGVQTS